MRIKATAKGRKGCISQAVGTLTLRTDCFGEAVQLKCLFKELKDGNLGFWAPLMFACQNNKVTKAQQKMFATIVSKVEKDFLKETEG